MPPIFCLIQSGATGDGNEEAVGAEAVILVVRICQRRRIEYIRFDIAQPRQASGMGKIVSPIRPIPPSIRI
jgi:hypothetical protein